MIRRNRWVPLMTLWVAVTLGAAEVRVDLGHGLNGAWRRPDAAWNGRTLVLLHGFADDMDGAADLLKRLAGDLATNGIASLRINFRGEGDRLRTNIASTFTTRVEDAALATAFVKKQEGVAKDRVGVLGWSLGGATAIESAAQEPGRYRCVVLWSSASGDLHAGITSGGFAATAAQADKEGAGTLEIPGWKTVTLRREFFDSFHGHDTDRSLAHFPGAFLSIRGTEDYLPQHEAAFLKAAPGHPREAILIGGADHIFNVFQPELGHADRVVVATVDWLKRVL